MIVILNSLLLFHSIVVFIKRLLKRTGVSDSCRVIFLGPVAQSIISLTSSLRGQLVKCFMTL